MASESIKLQFGSVPIAVPPLHYWAPTLPGWSSSSALQSSGLLSKTQLYSLDSFHALTSHEINVRTLCNQAKYYAAVAILISNPDLPVSRLFSQSTVKSPFCWMMRTTGDGNPPDNFTCRSMRAEVMVALYNLATASLQWVALKSTTLKENPSLLKVCIHLLGNAELIFQSLAQSTPLQVPLDITPFKPMNSERPPSPLFTLPQHLQLWSDMAFAQLSELFLQYYLSNNRADQAIKLCKTLVDAYDSLYERVKSQDNEHWSITPRFFQRLVATKRHYFRFFMALLALDVNIANGMEGNIRAFAEVAARETLKSLEKDKVSVLHIAQAIRDEIDHMSVDYAIEGAQSIAGVDPNSGWSTIYYTIDALVPPNSIRHPSKSADMPTEYADMVEMGKSMAFHLWHACDHNQMSATIDISSIQFTQWNAEVDALTRLDIPAPMSAPAMNVQVDQRFPNRNNLIPRLRRLGSIMRIISDVDDTKLPSQIIRLRNELYQQCIRYTRIIEAIFFDHTHAKSESAEVVSLQDIVNLAKAISRKSPDGDSVVDASLIRLTLEDDMTHPYIAHVDRIEENLRSEVNFYLKLAKPTAV